MANSKRPHLHIPLHTQVKFEAHPEKGIVRVQFPGFMLVDGIQFQSSDQMMEFLVRLMEVGKQVWPNDEVFKMYAEDE